MGNSRRVAAFIVLRWLLTKEFPRDMLPDGPDRAFVQDLVYTVIRRLRPLRKTLGELLKTWPKGELEALLYVGAAQVMYMDEVPDFAAVNETVSAAKLSSNPSIGKVVNAVLRNLIRRRGEFETKLAAADLGEREGYPSSIVRRWRTRYGDEGAEMLAKWHNQPAETYLARRGGSFVKLERGVRVEDVDGFADGDFIVQDPGTAGAVELMEIAPGDEVLDFCAAPGGKTVQMAWRGAKVTACEVNPKRRERMLGNLRRMKLEVTVVGEVPEGSDGRTFAKVLVDAPCSNTGVFRRRPDARWSWSEEKLKTLTRLQAEILDRAVGRVAPGGRLVYSTCSNEPEENQMQVERFLSRHIEFKLVSVKESVPYKTGCDGAFAAAMERKRTSNESEYGR